MKLSRKTDPIFFLHILDRLGAAGINLAKCCGPHERLENVKEDEEKNLLFWNQPTQRKREREKTVLTSELKI